MAQVRHGLVSAAGRNRPPLRPEGSPHSTLVPLLLTQLSSDWRLPMPIRANPMSIVCQSSFDDCL